MKRMNLLLEELHERFSNKWNKCSKVEEDRSVRVADD